jgi:[calcium/calmodulin-dependent protein kinase] kinase
MAPECLKENKNDKSGFDGKLADIWSLGVVLYCIVELKLPFQDDNML